MGKIMKWILGICGALLAAIFVISFAYLRVEWNRTNFFENSVLDGVDVSGMEPADVVPIIVDKYTQAKIHVMEGDREQAVWSLADVGYTVDEATLGKSIEDCQGRQKSSIAVLLDSLMNGNTFEVEVPFRYDAQKLTSTVNVAALADARVKNVDASMTYDEATKTYSIIPEVQGTELNDSDVQHLVQQSVDAVVGGVTPAPDITVSISPDLYLVPSLLSTDPDMNMKVNTFNSYDQAVITHVFGEEKVTIDWNTISNWVFFENGQGYLSEEKIREYIMNLGSKYNTIYYERVFHTTGGSDIVFGEHENNYGYLIDEEGEYAQLLSDIEANGTVEREPVYAYKGVGRNGTDDMLSYVEVSISAQHVWFYKNHELLTETDVVTGCIAKGTPTQTGIYPIAYKESPATLIPSNESNGTPVQYWMPFYDGQGLHDASWRRAFGGQIYQTSGSHGCVNMPLYAAELIFNNADTGTPVILY